MANFDDLFTAPTATETQSDRPQLTKEEYAAAQSEKFLEDTFGGSLPAFLAAFTRRKKLSETELAEVQDIIRRMGGQ